MIRYELKDKERQAALEKALPGFAEALQKAAKQRECDSSEYYSLDSIQRGEQMGSGEWMLVIPKCDVERIELYDPHAWNGYPRVTPPEGVWMRVETWSACGAVVRGVFMYANGTWRRSKYADPQNEIKAARFRPWDDGEEEK